MKKWLVGMACAGMLAAAAMDAMGGLIISQYYEGASNNKWIEIYNPGGSAVDLAGGGYRLGHWNNANREAWKSGTAPTYTMALSNSIAAGATFLVRNSSAVLPAYAVADQIGGGSSSVMGFNGDDSLVLYTGATYAFANVVDAFGMTASNGVDKSFVRTNTLTTGVNTDFSAVEWQEYNLAAVEAAGAGVNERLGYHSTGAAPIVTNVKFSASFALVDENQGTYQVTVYKTLPEGNVSGTITLSGTATEGGGADYTVDTTNFMMNGTTTSAVFTVTINDDAEAEAAETIVMTLANVVGAGTTAPDVFTLTINPSDQALYAITITTPTNGTVTTTPPTEAAAGTTVTINATPAGGYAVDTYSVVGADTTPVTVTGNTFTMPAQAVTVTVAFAETAASRIIISQYTETDTGSIPKGIEIWNVSGSDITFDGTVNLLDVKVGVGGGAPASAVTANSGTLVAGDVWVIGTTNMNPDLVEPFTFNGDDSVVVELGGVVQDVIGTPGVDPGTQWSGNGVSTMNQNIQLKTGITTGDTDGWTDPSVRFEYVAVGSDLTGFGLPPGGAAVFGVTVDKTDGFTVEEGMVDAITATAANGTAPYSYAWSSTLGGTYYVAVTNVFTILATAPTGSYSATVVATDSSGPAQNATNIVNFSVVTPATKYAITITPPTNGTVTTTPLTEAAAGVTVTINATPAGGYAVDTVTVVDEDMGLVTVTGHTFTMPAKAVTVTVTFTAVVAEGIAAFRFTDVPQLQVTTKDSNLTVTDMALTAGTIETNITTGTYFPNEPYIEETGGWTNSTQAGAKAFLFTITPAAGKSVDITGISFRAYATAAGPSAYGYDIGGGLATYAVDAPATNLVVVSQLVAGVTGQTGPVVVQIQGWLNGSRTSTGAGIFRLDDVVIYGSVSGTAASVVIGGDMTGTVGVQMDLTITLENSAVPAADWTIVLKDPDGADVTVYNWNPGTGAFSFTPAKVGSYFLSATALDAGMNPIASNSATLTVSAAPSNPPIPPITFVAGTGFTFTVPVGYTLNRVEGADAVASHAWNWTLLSSPGDYTLVGSTITIKSSAAAKRMIRIWLDPIP